MAANFSVSLSKMIISTIIIILSLTPLAVSVPSQELDAALSVLRYGGHALFANAIATSDLLFDLLSADSVTLLSPTDPMIFALDMTETLPLYISTLRLSAVPLRLTLSDLRSLPNASSIPTLLPSRHLLLTRPTSDSAVDDAIYLDGVRLLLPGLHYSIHVAVHGLAAVLPFSHTVIASPPADRHRDLDPVSPVGSTMAFGPVPMPSGSNRTDRTLALPQIPRIHGSSPTVASPQVTANEKADHVVAPASPSTESSPRPALNRPILSPSQVAHPSVPVPAPGPSRLDGYAPNGSPQISPATARKTARAIGDLNPPKIGAVSVGQMGFLLGMNGAQEAKILGMESEPLAMETSEF